MKLKLIVIYVSDPFISKKFYETVFDIKFEVEKHDSGPVHYSTFFEGVIFELYPQRNRPLSKIRLGFKVEDFSVYLERLSQLEHSYNLNNESISFLDLDGNSIELSAGF